MPRIVVSYRRDIDAGYAGRLYDRLVQEFGTGDVFMDIDGIPPGEDYLQVIERVLDRCEALVAVVGRQWLAVTNGNGLRRLDDPVDPVRQEIVAALARGVRVVPVLVGGASMPAEPDLPPDLRPLSRRQAVQVGNENFHDAFARLATALRSTAALGREVDQAWVRHRVELIVASQDDVSGGFRNQVFRSDAPARPQSWSTAQCLVALSQLEELGRLLAPIEAACDYLESTRKPGRGWGYDLVEDETAVTEVGAWVALAYLSLLEHPEVKQRAPRLAADLTNRVERGLDAVPALQNPAGGWSPVSGVERRNQRTYSTMMALWALIKARHNEATAAMADRYEGTVRRSIRWLLSSFDPRIGWVPNPDRRPQVRDFLGLTAQLLAVLHYAESLGRERDILPILQADPAYLDAKRWFLNHEDLAGRRFHWNDTLPDVDQELSGTSFRLEGSAFLWCPWSVLTLGLLAEDRSLDDTERGKAAALRSRCFDLLMKHREEVGLNGTYEVAEALLCLAPQISGHAPALGIPRRSAPP